MQTFWKIVQFILGFVLGLLLTAGIGAGIAVYLLSKLADTPSKPLFAETMSPPVVEEEVVIDISPLEEEEEEEIPQPEGYRAIVTWSDGLSVRSQPDSDSERLGGVAYNQELIVLGTNPDETWQRVVIPGTNLEGWVKAGNTSRID